MKRTRLIAEWLVLLVLAVLLVVVSQQRGWTERVELGGLDLASQFQGIEPDPSILLVEIDDKALEEQGNWPWDRARHAALIDALAVQRPDVIAVDILFVDPVTAEGDTALGTAISRAGNVTLPQTFTVQPGTHTTTVPLLPERTIARGAAQIGHVAVIPDSDGIVRRFEPYRQIGEDRYPHLALVTAELAAGQAGALPKFPEYEAIVPFAGASMFQSVSASAVLEGAVPADFFESRIVLVGATAQGLGDRYAVPAYAGRIMTGVEIQANFISAMLQGELIARAPTELALAIQIAAIVLLFMLFWRLPPRGALIGSIGLIAVLVFVTLLAIWVFRLWLPLGSAVLAIIVAYPLWGWRRLATVSHFLEREARALSSVENKPLRGSVVGFDVVARQVAEIRNLTSEISKSFKAIRAVLDASPDPMVVLDSHDRVVMNNDAAESVFDQRAAEDPQSLELWMERAGATLDGDRHEMNLPDGRVYLTASAPLDPEVGSRIIAMRDISEIKANERQRQEMLEFLSHDMRSPQVAIIGLIGTAGRDLSSEERLGRISDHARRTLKLTDDFVQIARLRNEGLQIAETELGSLIQEAADRAFPLARAKSITIDTAIPEEPCFALVDAEAISRVLDNLLGNATKFSPQASRITLDLQAGRETGIVIRLSDQGPGLPPERLDNPFARFGPNDTRAGPSAGLGLAYVKQVVDQHGGEISVRSSSADGATFEIVLPFNVASADE